jgi:excisionase family DNA binding protein
MSSTDARVRELFTHIRRALDIMEELMHRQSVVPAQQSRPEVRQSPPSPTSAPKKLAYSIKEVRELIGISNSSLYKEIGEGRLRAVKRGNRTIILASDLQDWVSGWPASRSSKQARSRER